MALKDILNNAKYADDMVIALPDGATMNVGEMRSLEAEEKQRLITRSQTLEQAEMALAERIMAAQRRGVTLSEEVQPTDREIRREAASQFGLSEDDPLLGQVAKEFKQLREDSKAREAAIEAKFTQELNTLKGITGKAIQVSLEDRYATQFELATKDMPKAVREKLKLEDAVNYATEHRIMDKAGRYQIDRAVEMLSWNDMKEHERAEMRTELQTKAQREAEMARMNRPSPNALRTRQKEVEGFNPLDGKGRTKSLDEALADAAKDDALWNSLATAASGFGPN